MGHGYLKNLLGPYHLELSSPVSFPVATVLDDLPEQIRFPKIRQNFSTIDQ